MNGERILFIEDDSSGREMVSFNLKKAGLDIDAVASGEDGLKIFDPSIHSLVITDVRMPGISGMDVLAAVKKKAPEIPVLVITAYANIELAIQAMKAGAYDFIGKPFNREHLLITIKKALESKQLKNEVHKLRLQATGVDRPIVYKSEAMQKVLNIVDKVAPSDATILITGESGTGKELVARRIHINSDRAEGPFVAANVAAMPSELLESELFGHEKGAFTGASKSRAGRFRKADKGTLFLDEIGELPFELQGKLLRALQERAIDVVGADKPIPVDVRIVAATNQNLLKAVEEGRFRDDLYYRINVVEIEVPPLRDRIKDIDPLTKHFVDKFANGRDLSIPSDLLGKLRGMAWPGNIRELENICQRLVLLCQGSVLSADDLPNRMEDDANKGLTGNNGVDEWPALPEQGLSLIDIERRVIERVLGLKGGNVSQSAVYLNIPRHVLAYRMEKYGIPRKS